MVSHSYCIRILAQCLKITEKVSFNIASEASYDYILCGQKFIENAKKWSICGQTVLPDRLDLKGQKNGCDILSNFQTM